MSEVQTVRRLDLTGEVCPWPVIYTVKELKKLQPGEVLEVLTDHVPSTFNIPDAARQGGHEVLDSTRVDMGVYKITIRKAG